GPPEHRERLGRLAPHRLVDGALVEHGRGRGCEVRLVRVAGQRQVQLGGAAAEEGGALEVLAESVRVREVALQLREGEGPGVALVWHVRLHDAEGPGASAGEAIFEVAGDGGDTGEVALGQEAGDLEVRVH